MNWRYLVLGLLVLGLVACSSTASLRFSSEKQPASIALLLPKSGSLQNKAAAVSEGFHAAYQRSPNGMVIHDRDTREGSLSSLYKTAQHSGANYVVGPLSKEEVGKVAKEGKTRVITLALNYSEGELPKRFYEFGLSPQDEVEQVVARAWREGHRKALIVVSSDAWGRQVANAFQTLWVGRGGKVIAVVKLNDKNNIMDQLQTLLPEKEDVKSPPFDVMLLSALPPQARSSAALFRFYGLVQIPIYATSSVYSGTPSPEDKDLDGVRVCDIPWVVSPTTEMISAASQIRALHPGQFDIRLYALGIDAYRILPELARLAASSSASYQGLTGRLHMENQRIKRELAWGQFVNGEIIPLA